MSAVKYLATAVIFCLSASAFAAGSDAVSLVHYESLQRLNLQGAGSYDNQKLSAAGPIDVTFDAFGRTFDLELTPNTNLLNAARVADGPIPYRGKLAGNSESWVRIVVADGVPAGLIWDGRELFAIERPGDNLAGSSGPIVFRLADAVIVPGAMTCGAGGGSFSSGATMYKSLGQELQAAAQAPGAVSEINVGTIGDFEFFGQHGADSDTAIMDRMSNVDGIFSTEVGIQINVPEVEIFSDASDPFSDELNASLLLDEVAVYRSNTSAQNANGLTHLWTGRDVENDMGGNSTVGIAFTGALCLRQFGAGLSEGTGTPTFDALIAAHEIGHNFGAPHDAQQGSTCEDEADTFLMAASLNGSNQFSQCSKDQMADDIANANCIAPLPSVDMRIDGDDPTVLLGNTATVTIDVANAGTLPATNVTADISLPNNVSLISVATSIGSCSDNGGVVNCNIGDVDGTGAALVTLTSDTTGVGVGQFNASVSADVDDNMTNNQGTAMLTVQPAVNLGISGPALRRVDLDQSTTLVASFSNTSILGATGVTLGIDLSPGLRADSASWPIGSCTVNANQVDCTAPSFASGQSTSLSLGITAIAEGANSVSFDMSSAEADADPSNNTAMATVNVGAIHEEDDGGGSTGALFLFLLAMLSCYRKLVPYSMGSRPK